MTDTDIVENVTENRRAERLWYVATMSDGLAIVDVKPAPAPVDTINPHRPAPSLIIPLRHADRVTQEVTEEIVREHNAALARVCEPLDCPMCDARKKFIINPLDATVGYCMAEQKAWRVTSLTCVETGCLKPKATFGDYCMEHLTERVNAEG